MKGLGMPHFGHMDESKLTKNEADLLRARLHLRSGKRRLSEGKLRSGVATMFDALYSAMRAYVMAPANHSRFEGVGLGDAQALYEALLGAGVLDGRFEFTRFMEMVEKAVDDILPEYESGYDSAWIIDGIKPVMTQLGVLPFDESTLPKEEPGAF